jgi:phosphatidylglycerophosphate synthase
MVIGLTVTREILVTVHRLRRKDQSNHVIAANGDGKRKMVAQVVGVSAAILAMISPAWLFLAWPALVGSVWYALKAVPDYLRS